MKDLLIESNGAATLVDYTQDQIDAQAAKRAAVVPRSVLPRAFRLALNEAGLRDAVETAVAGADQTTKDTWEYANSIERHHPLMISMAAQLKISDQQLDDLFRLAATK